MFITLIVFVFALILEAIMIFLLTPENSDGTLNTLNAFLFSANTGVLFGSLYSLVLVITYWIMKSYEEIREKKYLRRSIIFGIVVFVITLLKLFDLLDYYILAGIVIASVSLEIILSRREDS